MVASIIAREVCRVAGWAVAALLVVPALGVQPATAADPEDATSEAAPASKETARSIIADLEAATDKWERSCRKPNALGLCIEIKASHAGPKRCGAAELGRIRVRPRRAKLAARAQRQIAAAVERASSVGEPEDEALRMAFREALGGARLAQADRDLEAYLALTMPKGLDFVVEEWKRDAEDPKLRREYKAQRAKKKRSQEAFSEYFETKTRSGRALEQAYIDIKATKSGPAVVRAALRSAWVAQNFADELRSSPVPSSLDDPDHRAAYCDAIEDQTEAPRRMARERAQYCVDQADALKLTVPAVELCRALLEG